MFNVAKKQPQPEAPKSEAEQLNDFLQGEWVQKSKRAEDGRNEGLEDMLRGIIMGGQLAEATIRRALEGNYRAMQQSIGIQMKELMAPVEALRQQMQQDRMQSPEALAAKFASGVAPAQRPKPVTLKEPEGEVVDLDKVGKIIAPEKPKTAK